MMPDSGWEETKYPQSQGKRRLHQGSNTGAGEKGRCRMQYWSSKGNKFPLESEAAIAKRGESPDSKRWVRQPFWTGERKAMTKPNKHCDNHVTKIFHLVIVPVNTNGWMTEDRCEKIIRSSIYGQWATEITFSLYSKKVIVKIVMIYSSFRTVKFWCQSRKQTGRPLWPTRIDLRANKPP